MAEKFYPAACAGSADEWITAAESKVLAAIATNKIQLCAMVATAGICAEIQGHEPPVDAVELRKSVTVQIDTGARLDAELKSFHELVAKPDPVGLIARYPVRESGALDGIAKGLGLGSRSAYEAMALKLLEDDGALLQTARDHLKCLIAELSSAASSVPSTT